MPERVLYVWVGFRSQQGFPGHDIVVLVLCHDGGSLFRDMVLWLHAVARSRHSPSMSR